VETGIVAIVALLGLLVGTIVVLIRNGMVPLSLPAFRVSGMMGGSSEPHLDDRADYLANDTLAESSASGAGSLATGGALTPLRPLADSVLEPEPFRLDRPLAASPALDIRLDQLEDRLDELQRAIERQGADYRAELARLSAELASRSNADDARRDVAFERIRADLTATIDRATMADRRAVNGRRAEVCADLYARLARLEAAISAVTNPVLLPGEPFTPPDELLAEALIWENWNDVGELAFALADAFSAQRLVLSDQARIDLGNFVTEMRRLLTRSIYPNLHIDADAAQQQAVRGALAEFATALPKVRDSLDREYRENGYR
jgi:hypothetical protein